MGHATEAGAVPVYDAGFFVEGAFLGGFGFEIFGVGEAGGWS